MKIDFYLLRKDIVFSNSIKPFQNAKTIIIVPHADDEWVGCSQLIVTNRKHIILCYMNMLGDDSDEVHSIRYGELKSVANAYGLHLVTTGVEKEEKIQNLTALLIEERPEYIAVPFYYDWHSEHIEVMQILKASLNKIFKAQPELVGKFSVLMYQVSVPIPIEKVTHFIAMDKEAQKRKWSFFDSVYRTQEAIPWIRFRYNERINGGLCGNYAAEVYVLEKAEKWTNSLDKEILSEAKRERVFDSLQDLKKVREVLPEMEWR